MNRPANSSNDLKESTTSLLQSLAFINAKPISRPNSMDNLVRGEPTCHPRRRFTLDSPAPSFRDKQPQFICQPERRRLTVHSPTSYLPFMVEQKESTVRTDYKLGDAARSASHMIVASSLQEANERVSKLKRFDFAFIRRSDGSWTYGILALQTRDGSDNDYMMFVLDGTGATKLFRRQEWAGCIRRVAREDDISRTNNARRNHTESIPECIIIASNRGCYDDCSMISF